MTSTRSSALDRADANPQDFRHFLAGYRAAHPDDVLTISERVSADQDATALVWQLAAQNRHPLLAFEQVDGL